MPRRYRISTEGVSVSAAQDLIQVNGASGKMVKVLGVGVGASNQSPTNQQIALRCRYLPATVTNGSGGSTPTPRPIDPGDAAATLTARANSTTQATTSGTAILLHAAGANLLGGYDFMFPSPILVPSGAAFTFELTGAPTGTVNLSSWAEVVEEG